MFVVDWSVFDPNQRIMPYMLFKELLLGFDFSRFAWNDTVALIIYYVSGISMFNVAPLIAIVILYSRIMQALRKKFNSGPLSGNTNSEGKRCKQLQHIMKIFKSIVIADSTCFFLFCAYLILKMTFPEIFIKDKCKWILVFFIFCFSVAQHSNEPSHSFL